ncbi:regulatory protein cys-3 [Lophiotrema nucula]|uniref:Regulatory protein cys-3 n=1 Tax=Lophiotrema nucula TaxID=690887 RepID=A0A6A5ZFZ7_9PLEO|nr:regulatory protein cys-3 [Lophiotrema nucula]
MTGYNGRRGPNVSQYVANLNTVPPQNETLPDPLEFDPNEFSAFTEGEFIDWNGGSSTFNPNDTPLDLDNVDVEQPSVSHTRSNSVSIGAAQPKMDNFTLDGDFQFAEFNFQDPIVNQPMQHLQSQTGAYPVQYPHNAQTSPVSTSLSPITPGFDQSGKKRKLDVETNSQQELDEAARNAAEEDKRRRNTAASARFRIKKKQREQALEKTAKEMTDRVNVLETRIQQLETENTWLKGLITEKNGGSKSSADISAMLRKRTEENTSERSSGNRTDGVGTKSKDDKA